MLAGRYRIAGLLGGAHGRGLSRTDLTLGQVVALKFLPEATSRDERLLARFYNEVRIARQVAHPNVCRSTTSASGRAALHLHGVRGW